MNRKPSLQTIYSNYSFRHPRTKELDHVWSTTWYRLELEESLLASEAEALAIAEKAWEEERFEIPFLVRQERTPDFLGRLVMGWSVYYLDLVGVSDLPLVEDGRLEVFVKELDETPFSYQRDAVASARYRWKKEQGGVPVTVTAEVLDKSEIVRRRLERSAKLALR